MDQSHDPITADHPSNAPQLKVRPEIKQLESWLSTTPVIRYCWNLIMLMMMMIFLPSMSCGQYVILFKIGYVTTNISEAAPRNILLQKKS